MSFQDHKVAPQAGFRTDTFVVRPIRATDAQLDFDAVMESRELLRGWEQTGWPEDDFTVDANRADLEDLEHRHNQGYAFTYTVLNPAETECLGCVYLMPTDARSFSGAEVVAARGERWEDYIGAIYFWVRTSGMEHDMDRMLLRAIRPWFSEEWNLGAHVYVTSELFVQQVKLLEAEALTLRFTIHEPDKAGAYLAFR